MKIEQYAERPLIWVKSSYSGGSGGDCVEVAVEWMKSSYSDNEGGNCVEVAVEWIKSTYSGSGGQNCVEVSLCPAAVHIRDSKDPDKGTLSVSPAAWSAFVDSARRH